MLELRTFGGLSVEANGAPQTGAAVQRKTLALLALLAAAGKKGLSRDKLIAYLWPESDTARGRNLLNQACYALRRDLRERELFLGATELRLNPAVATSDLGNFEDALERGDRGCAVRLYAGPFLDGFFLSEASEFERWMEGERTRLAKRVSEALEFLARDATAHGDHRPAADWWRRLTQHDPLSSRAAVGLMTALDEIGERAEAIRHGRAHEALVRQELGAEPASEVSALVRRLHHRSADGERPSRVSSAAGPARVDGEAVPAPTIPAMLFERVRRAHMLSLIAVGAVVVLLVGGAASGFWRRQPAATGAEPVALPGRKMLAVLPFENRGAAADEYFADGLSEAIATRLGSIQRLGVIAWPSASQYKETSKSPQEIGRELGVQYILQGSVRWEKTPGVNRVRVSPSLIRVSDAAQLWADQYDTTMSGVFAVQTTLATRVAGALDLALADAERRLLEARPTANLQAYDAYLRGRELVDREWDPANARAAVDLWQRAVAVDSNFALAHAWLSIGYVFLHFNYMDRSPDQLTHAKAALDRALRLDSDLPESHFALGFYYYSVVGDNGRALQEYLQARRLRPNDPWFTAAVGDAYLKQGRWNEMLAYWREAIALDPRNFFLLLRAGGNYSALRQFAMASYYYDRAVALNPQSFDALLGRALAHLSQTGDLAEAQRLLPDLSQTLDPIGFGVPIHHLCDVATLLDAGRKARLLALTPAAMKGDTAVLALTKAMVLRADGHPQEARAQFDSARMILERNARNEPNDDNYAALLGLALAGLRRSADAIREGERAVALVPVSKDAEWSGYPRANLARIYVVLGQRDKAIDQLEIVLSRPGPLSAGWLRTDPFWDPLRGSPRFQRLVAVRS
jgi:DNA-binding SARP family transcriptional activator/TolB-like protein/tetratricopeptide (TPR) repeat protein